MNNDKKYSKLNINNYHRMIRAWKRIQFLSIENIFITTCKLILWPTNYNLLQNYDNNTHVHVTAFTEEYKWKLCKNVQIALMPQSTNIKKQIKLWK